MDKYELIITTAKEIYLKYAPYSIGDLYDEGKLKKLDQGVKAIVKTISEAYNSIYSLQKG